MTKPQRNQPRHSPKREKEIIKDVGTELEEHFRDCLRGPVESLEHDANLHKLTEEGFQAASDFIHACGKVAVWRLRNSELAGKAGFYVTELMQQLAHVVYELVQAGDLMTARRLPLPTSIYQSALAVYGPGICNQVVKRDTIRTILKQHNARALLEMVSALHPDWDAILHIDDRKRIEALSEDQLTELLLSKERRTTAGGGEKAEWRTHRLAEIIENVVAIREMEAANLNLFVAHLRRGWLWGGPLETFKKCPWNGQCGLPALNDWSAWRKMVMPFLKQETAGDASRLLAFEHMLAARRYVYAGGENTGGRLAGDSPTYIWNQVENRIGKAWATVARREIKRNPKRTA